MYGGLLFYADSHKKEMIVAMTKQEFAQLCEKNLLMLDGATGSNLQKRGMPFGVCPEAWIAEHPDELIRLQKEYVKAGSNVIYAPTFTANPIKLKEYNLEEKTEELNRSLVQLSRQAADGRALVAGDVTMTGQQLAPLGTLTAEELIACYRRQISALAGAGADLLVIETMMSLAETRTALIAAREVCDLPVMVTMSFDENGRTLYGTGPRTALLVLQGLGADAVGINCGSGPDRIAALLKEMRPYASVPLIAKPNAGLPHLNEDGTTSYDMDAEVFAGYVPALVEAGARIIGGCCGTDPSYIDLTARQARQLCLPEPAAKSQERFLTTERAETRVDLPDVRYVCLDPADDEELAQDYENGDFDTLYDRIDEASDDEADVLVLSVDETAEDADQFILVLIQETMQYSPLPLAFCLGSEPVLRAALRSYPGIAGVILKDGADLECAGLCAFYGAVLLDKKTIN